MRAHIQGRLLIAFCALAICQAACIPKAPSCAEADPEELHLIEMILGDYALQADYQAAGVPLKTFLNADEDHPLHLRIVDETLVELAFMREGKVVVETYAVKERRKALTND
ncbi:hypothetical protein DL240_11630 [Lujinxingia litoralis]|uniref:Uncharacterized protein n=1 Tax=Lujinxingia litoralis TaxID=2211119 RepID=A0A328C825_9DELT|nr:hypothetical protein [Lujinxingia litoralis]RAL21506.1 hypothetical protein DL240_11630 [Lujinxingia litoralis]